MELPIHREWADLAAHSFPVESTNPTRRDQAQSLFYAGAGVVAAGVADALESGDPLALRTYLLEVEDDLAQFTTEKSTEYGVKT